MIKNEIDDLIILLVLLFVFYVQGVCLLLDNSITNFVYFLFASCIIPALGLFGAFLFIGNKRTVRIIYAFNFLFVLFLLTRYAEVFGTLVISELLFKDIHFHLVAYGTIIAYFCVGFYLFNNWSRFSIFLNVRFLFINFVIITLLYISKFDNIMLVFFGFNPPSNISILGLSETITLISLFILCQFRNYSKFWLVTLVLIMVSFYYSRTSVLVIFVAIIFYTMINTKPVFKKKYIPFCILFGLLFLVVDLNDFRATSWLVNRDHLTSLFSRIEIKGQADYLFSGVPVTGYPSWQLYLMSDLGKYNHDITSYLYQYGFFGFVLIVVLLYPILYIRTLKSAPTLLIPYTALLISIVFSRSVFYPNVWLIVGMIYSMLLGKNDEGNSSLHQVRSE